MGEVYKARDPRLNRLVALKRLLAGATTDPERRERFEREAQMVAALNHPHIVTIYSVEQADGQFFLTMELVEGRSLAEAMPRGGLSLDRVLTIAIPVADAIAAAHHKGITHRDLKPANIMLGEGEQHGRVKVLDFGLAKLSEAPVAAARLTAMPTAPITGEGRILGTVAYMSPEQAEGKPIDARSDLFSLGVVLYEMATGVRPFTGDTSLSILSSILKDTPKPVTDLNPDLPRELGRIIRRALAKDLDRRYQTAKDLRNDLEDLKASIDSGELQTPGVGRPVERRRGPAIAIAAILATAVVVVAGIYRFTSRPAQPVASAPAAALQDLAITQLTTTGDAARPALSPDGKYVAYVQQTEVPGPRGVVSADSVRIHQIVTSSDGPLVAPEAGVAIGGLTVTPDGNYVYYLRRSGTTSPALWRVSFLGGAPKKLLDDVWTPIGWSPDGQHMAFVRSHTRRGSSELVVAETDGGNARVHATRKLPALFDSLALTTQPSVRPAWSLDGRVIAVPGAILSPARQEQIVFVDARTGSEQAVPLRGAFGVPGLDWLDRDSLVLNQLDLSGPSQLWRLEYPSGAVTRLTNDLTSYQDVSLTVARDSLATTKTDLRVAVWVIDGARANGKEVVAPRQSSGAIQNVTWAADRLLFTSLSGGHRSILSVGLDGGRPQDLVPQAYSPTTTSDGRTVVFSSADPARLGLWKATDVGRSVPLTEMQAGWPIVTGDDRSVVFTSLSGGGTQSLWIVSIDGGTPTLLANRFASQLRLSLDGQSLAFNSFDDQGRPVYVFCELPDCSSLQVVPPPNPGFPGPTVGRQFLPNRGIPYVTGSPPNVWIRMLDSNAKPSQITNFTDNRQILDVAWSRDGTRLAVARATETRDIVLIKGLKK
jgi:Tol biopolymer transport system component/tRNA A-37 threonylcarbamoyl transferase component Bud32